MDKESLRVAIGLRLGVKICKPYTCVCGYPVNEYGLHGLSCSKNKGKYNLHPVLNDIIKKALTTVGYPAMLEPPGLIRKDGKRPDGITLTPWSHGKCLIWDATCVDTLAESYYKGSSKKAATAANTASSKKEHLYEELTRNHHFLPFAVESFGTFGDSAKSFVNKIGSKLIKESGDKKAKSYFIQRISLAIQRSNVAKVFETIPLSASEKLNEIFYLT